MFVLDCSATMITGRLMQPAKLALQRVLGVLYNSKEPYVVGLRAYGNRTGFNLDGGIRKRLAQFPDVAPDLDVELVRPMEKLNANLLDRLHDDLGTGPGARLDGYGQTPLYLALKTCFDQRDFEQAGNAEPKRIVVITDGVNDQFKQKTTTARNVLSARAQSGWRDMPIDVIGLGLAENAQTLKQQLRNLQGRDPPANSVLELAWLAQQTGGIYLSASEETLGESLRTALGLVRFSVRPPHADSVPDSSEKELGETWQLEGLADNPGEYRVQLHGVEGVPAEQVRLEGGENLVLQFDRLGNRLLYPEHTPPDARGDIQHVTYGQPAAQLRIQALMPRPAQDAAGAWDFFVYVQQQSMPSEEYRFTARPRHVWAEIQPRSQRRDVGAPYIFCDCDFVQDQPVPVLRFHARGWPSQADAALVRLWIALQQQDVSPDDTRTVATFDHFQARGIPGVSFDVAPLTGDDTFRYRVRVTENRTAADNPEAVRIQLNPPAERILRRHFLGVNVIHHFFDYRAQSPAELQVTSRRTSWPAH